MQSLQLLLGLAQRTGVGDGGAMRVRIELLEPNINAHLSTRCHMLHLALCLDSKLVIVAVCPLDNTHSLDVFDREGRNLLVLVADQTQTPDGCGIGEGEVASVGVQFPPGLLVLHTSIVVLKLRIAFLSQLVLAAVVIEALNGRPCAVGADLSRLRVQASGKGVRFGKHGTGALQVIVGDATLIHPEAQAFVADELHDADGFINGDVLLWLACQFVFQCQHGTCPFVFSLLY